jgi:glycosyltransferase involved in cell wall biosynthesis
MSKVSIIIPCYNAGRYILNTVQCCLEQTYKNLEIILVNDGSTDNTWELLKTLSCEHSNIHVFSTENKGASLARKFGLQKANGEFVFFVDADDEIKRNAIELLVKKQRVNNYDIVVGQHEIFKKNRVFAGRTYTAEGDTQLVNVRNFLINRYPIFLWGQLYRKSLLEKVEFYDFTVGEDMVINTQLMLFPKIKVSFIEEVVYKYVINNSSLSQSKSSAKTAEGISAHKKMIELINKVVDGRFIRSELAHNYLNLLYALIILKDSESLNIRNLIKKEFPNEYTNVLNSFGWKRKSILKVYIMFPGCAAFIYGFFSKWLLQKT